MTWGLENESSVPMTSPTDCRHVTTFYPVTTIRSTWNIFTSFNTKKWQFFFILWLWKRFKSFYCFYKFPIILATLPVLDMIWLWSFYQPSTIFTRFYDVSFSRDIRRVGKWVYIKVTKIPSHEDMMHAIRHSDEFTWCEMWRLSSWVICSFLHGWPQLRFNSYNWNDTLAIPQKLGPH